jgi:hypothetical protein
VILLRGKDPGVDFKPLTTVGLVVHDKSRFPPLPFKCPSLLFQCPDVISVPFRVRTDSHCLVLDRGMLVQDAGEGGVVL